MFFNGSTVPSGPRPHYRSFTVKLMYTSLGRSPLDEQSARRRNFYLATHNTQKRQTSMAQRDSNPQSQDASGHKPMSSTARPPGSAYLCLLSLIRLQVTKSWWLLEYNHSHSQTSTEDGSCQRLGRTTLGKTIHGNDSIEIWWALGPNWTWLARKQISALGQELNTDSPIVQRIM